MKMNIKLLWLMSVIAIATASEDEVFMKRRRLETTNSPSTSLSPSTHPSGVPSSTPTFGPTLSINPSSVPSGSPSFLPSSSPSGAPSNTPTESISPSSHPTVAPSASPSALPSEPPSSFPSASPTGAPSDVPSESISPSSTPSVAPSSSPTGTPSNVPSTNPTITGSPSAVPSSTPTVIPTATNCELLVDSTESFEIPNGPIVTCENVKENWRRARCKHEIVQEYCPFTCNDICFFSQPTAAPTVSPTTPPPVPIEATVQIRLGPVDGNIMDSDSVSYFTRIVGEFLQDKLNEQEYPKIDLTDLEITKQTISGSLIRGHEVLVNLKVSAMIIVAQSTRRKMVETSDFAMGLLDILTDDDFVSDLINDLKGTSVAGAEYFEDITQFSVNSLQNANSLETDSSSNSTGLSQKNIIIIAASAAAGAAAIFAIGFFVWQRKKRTQIVDKHDDLDLDDEENFGIGPEKDEWDQMQPERPFSNSRSKEKSNMNPFYDSADDGTEGGKSQRTFNTLEKIYSNGSDDGQGSFGYSLDSAVASKPMASVTSGKSDDKSAPLTMDLYGLASKRFNFDHDMELSLCSPTSAYSGLTYDSSSLKGAKLKTPMNEGMQSDLSDDASDTVVRECVAPPGKLGVVIDTTKDGPIVHLVKEGSPLENQIFPGDRIIAIDAVDTTSMSASNVTKIMASKMNSTRKITVSSKILSGAY